MLSIANKLFVKPVEYERFTGDQRELERAKMYDLQAQSSKKILIVAGELDPKFYNETFVNIISKKFKDHPDFNVKILFSKDESLDYKEKLKLIYAENTQLCNLLDNGAFEGRLSMFLSQKRVQNHFGIVDNSILIEKIHKQGDPRDVLLVDNYKPLIEKYERYFDKLTTEPEDDNIITTLTFDDFKEFAA